MGGETCALSSFCACPNALNELARMHWSFLNRDYNASVLNTWVSGGCMDEVTRRLGYRFQLLQGTFDDSVRPGSALSIQLRLTNTGWAAPYNPRRVEIILRNLVDNSTYYAQLPEEPRFWFAGDTTTVTAGIGVPAGMPAGAYALLLNLDDPSPSLRMRPEYSIRCANDSVWEPATGYNSLLHTVRIDPSALGTPYADTLFFRWLNGPEPVKEGRLMPHPTSPLLFGNFPNPFNGRTAIAYSLPMREHVVIRLHNLLGQELQTVSDSIQEAGRHNVYVDATGLASGVYYYTLQADNTSLTGRLILLR